MKEYSILIICNGGCPYSLGSYPTFSSAKMALMNIISDFDYKLENMRIIPKKNVKF